MRVKTVYPILLVLVLAITSCQKEVDYVDLPDNGNNPVPGGPNPQPGTSDRSIQGDWRFVKMTINLSTTMEMPVNGMNGKFVATIDGGSKDESGTLKIDATTFKSPSLSYSQDIRGTLKTYANGMLISNEAIPIDNSQQPSVPVDVTYTRIGNDSLKFSGALVEYEGFDFADFDMPTGARVGWIKDTLVLTSNINDKVNDNSSGMPMVITAQGRQVLKFVKQ